MLGEQLPDHRVPPFLPRLPQLWPLPLPALETRRLPEGPTKGAERSGPFRLSRPVTEALPTQKEGTPMLGKGHVTRLRTPVLFRDTSVINCPGIP